MQFALLNNIRSEASKNAKGKCELCEQKVFAKIYENKLSHWSHYRNHNKDCDEWWENETEWHRNWKSLFPIENREVVICKNNIKHRADVLTLKGNILEFQNSPLNIWQINEREEFYGEQLVWILNAQNFKPDLYILKNPIERSTNLFKLRMHNVQFQNNEFPFKWFNAKGQWISQSPIVYFDLGNEYLYTIKLFSQDKKTEMGICIEWLKAEVLDNL